MSAAGDCTGQPSANDHLVYDQRGVVREQELPGLDAGYHGDELHSSGGQLQFRDGDAERGVIFLHRFAAEFDAIANVVCYVLNFSSLIIVCEYDSFLFFFEFLDLA